MSLTVHTEQRGDLVVVSISGELDMTTAPQLQERATELLDKGQNRLVLNLTGLSFCDSTGLSVFVRVRNDCVATGGALRLAAPQRNVLRVLEISGLAEALRPFTSVAEAEAAHD